MKTVLAIVCSLALVWIPLIQPVQAAGFAAAKTRCCHCAAKCCAVPTTPESQPPVAPPAGSHSSNYLIAPAPALVWLVPDFGVRDFGAARPDFLSAPVSVFARNCVRLI